MDLPESLSKSEPQIRLLVIPIAEGHNSMEFASDASWMARTARSKRARSRRILLIGGALLALVAVVNPASAVVATVTISNGTLTDVVNVNLTNPDPNNPNIYIGGGMSIQPGAWTMNSPFFVTAELGGGKAIINSVMGIKNLDASTKSFTVDFEVPAVLADVESQGHSLVGASGIGQLTSTGNNPLYQALVDGSPVPGFDLLPAVQTINLGGGGSGQVGPVSFGDPVFVPGVDITSSIGMRWQFDLTTGDAASWNSNFVNCVVPEPASWGMLVLGVGLLFALVRRGR